MIEQQPTVVEPTPILEPGTVVSLSDAAASKLRELTKDETNPDIGLRVYVYSGGCSGFRYGMMLEDAPTPEDKVLHASGIKVYVDGQSIALLQGSQIDYVDTLMGAGFTVNNPNAVAACGCGSSFRTADDDGVAQGLLPLIALRYRLEAAGRTGGFFVCRTRLDGTRPRHSGGIRASRLWYSVIDGDPALPAAHGALSGHRPAAPHLRGALSGDDPALPRYRRAVRGRAHPRRPRGRHGQDGDARRRRGVRRDPRGRALPGRPVRPAGRRDRAVRDRVGGRPDRAVPGRRGDAARRRGRRRAPGRAPGRGRDPSFVRYLDLMRARDGETTEVLDIRVEIESQQRRRRDGPRARPPGDGGPRGRQGIDRSRRPT